MSSPDPATPGRSPPHDLAAERAVLGGVLIAPTKLPDVVSMLDVREVFLPAHVEIFEAMVALDRRGAPVDVVALANELRVRGVLARLDGGEAYLITLANSVPSAENVLHYARIVKEKAALRRLIGTCAELQARAYGDPGDVEDFLAEAKAQVARIGTAGRGGPARVSELVPAALDAIEAKTTRRDGVAVPVGLSRFDEKLGGLFAENLIVIAGRPGTGKTAFAGCTSVRAAAVGVPTLFFSREMSKQELIERFLAFLAPPAGTDATDITNGMIRRGRLEASHWNQIHPASTSLRQLPIWIDDTTDRIDQMIAHARSWRAQVAPILDERDPPRALVVVDYMQRVRGDRREGRQQEVAGISWALKSLAKTLKVPVLAVSQMNREVDKSRGDNGAASRDPRISDLKESGDIEQDADVIIFTHRNPRRGYHLLIAKNRNDQVGWIPAEFRAPRTAIYDAPDRAADREDGAEGDGRYGDS